MKKLVVLTGAGMSTESGISTFRDAGGLWDKYPVEHEGTFPNIQLNTVPHLHLVQFIEKAIICS